MKTPKAFTETKVMNWKRRNAEERFYEVRAWYWSKEKEDYTTFSCGCMTLDEAKQLFDEIKVTETTPQIDIYEEHEDSFEKIAVKDECFPAGTWDRKNI